MCAFQSIVVAVMFSCRLVDSLTQKTKAEAVMMRAFRAYRVAAGLSRQGFSDDLNATLLDRVHEAYAHVTRERGKDCILND
eukprot:115732-Chlamydomonas_euryale.AAC.1